MQFLVCLAKRIWIEDTTDLDYFGYSINNFNIQNLETYEKAIVSDQAKKLIKAMPQKMQTLIDHQT